MHSIVIFILVLFLAGCNISTGVTSSLTAADNALARLAQNQIAPACAIISVATGYFDALSPSISQANQRRYAQARAIVDPICANPPVNTVQALTTLNRAWFTIQSATVSK